jgi:ABC-type multidrug transport system permease subunit
VLSDDLSQEHLMDRYSLGLIWTITALLIFTNVYLIWTQMLDAT